MADETPVAAEDQGWPARPSGEGVSMDTDLLMANCDCGHLDTEHADILDYDGSVWPHARGACFACVPPVYCLRFSLVETAYYGGLHAEERDAT